MKTIPPLCVLAVLAGCTYYTPAPADRAAVVALPPLPEEEWPARDIAVVGATALPSMSELYTVQLASDTGATQTKVASAAGTPLSRIHFNGAAGKGVLRVYDDLGAAGDRDGARFVTSWQLAAPSDPAAAVLRARMYERTGARLLSTSSHAAAPAAARVEDLPLQGVSIALPREDASYAAPRPRGLILFFDGVLTSDYERPLVRTLESRGWAVVTIGTVTAMRRDRAPVHVASADAVVPAAREIAAGVDDALAESAYAAEAVLEYLATNRPDVPQRPLILAGCSIGACAVPVAAARLGDSVDGAILVGGGANMLDIALRSDASNLGITVDWGGGAASIERNTDLLVEYLRASRLDPYRTAPYLAGKPVLCVHAVFDAIVPAAAGRLLYARLGSPDRLRFNGGGTAMMSMMDDVAPQIATWLDRALYDRSAVAPADYYAPQPASLTPPLPDDALVGPPAPPGTRAGAAKPAAEPLPDLPPAKGRLRPPPPAGRTGGAKKAAIIDLD